jgi:hypothetical protein
MGKDDDMKLSWRLIDVRAQAARERVYVRFIRGARG